MTLNQQSMRLIDNIYNAMKRAYPQYKIEKYENGNWQLRTVFIDVTHRDGTVVNKYLFCPSPSGSIASISIYGIQLQGHFNTISKSRNIFGLPVEDIAIDKEGISDFVDITLGNYSHLNPHIMYQENEVRAALQSIQFRIYEMIEAKKRIQTIMAATISSDERIALSRDILCDSLIEKVIMLGTAYCKNNVGSSLQDKVCIAMATGTILKELDGGNTDYVSYSYLTKLVNRF